jgi:hypothetical protein
VGVLGHAATLVGVKEDIIDIERSGDKRLLVGGTILNRVAVGRSTLGKVGYREEALIRRAELKVDFDLVVLEGNKGKSKTGVAAEPELERNIESRLREGVARGTDSGWDI